MKKGTENYYYIYDCYDFFLFIRFIFSIRLPKFKELQLVHFLVIVLLPEIRFDISCSFNNANLFKYNYRFFEELIVCPTS